MDMSNLKAFEAEHKSVGKAFVNNFVEMHALSVMPKFVVGVDPAKAAPTKLTIDLAKVQTAIEAMNQARAAQFNKLYESAFAIDMALINNYTGAEGAVNRFDPALEKAHLLEVAALLEWEPPRGSTEDRYAQITKQLYVGTEDGYCVPRIERFQVCDVGSSSDTPRLQVIPVQRHFVCAMGKLLMMKGVAPRSLPADFGGLVERAQAIFRGLSRQAIGQIVKMNDRGASFREIAGELRQRAAEL